MPEDDAMNDKQATADKQTMAVLLAEGFAFAVQVGLILGAAIVAALVPAGFAAAGAGLGPRAAPAAAQGAAHGVKANL